MVPGTRRAGFGLGQIACVGIDPEDNVACAIE